MIRNITFTILVILSFGAATHAQQVIFSQNFEDTASLFQDYVLSNLDKADPAGTEWDTLQTVPWFVSLAGQSGNHAAIATSNYDPAAPADDWFVTPAIRLGEKSILTFKSLSLTPGTTDTYEVYVSNTEQSVSGCLFNPVAGNFSSSQSSSFETQTLDLADAGYANQMVFIGFRLTTTAGGDKIAIDDIEVTETVTQFKSLTFLVNMSEYISDSLFFPSADTVDIAGTFNNFDGTKNIMSLVPGTDSAIYKAVIPGFLDGDRLEFKFRINSSWNDSTVEFPYGLPNRVWIIEPGKYFYTCYYNDLGTSYNIPENPLMEQVNIYPNPARDKVAINTPGDIRKIRMLTLNGSKLLERDVSAGTSISLDVSSIAKGTYLMLFYTNHGFAGSKKLIIN